MSAADGTGHVAWCVSTATGNFFVRWAPPAVTVPPTCGGNRTLTRGAWETEFAADSTRGQQTVCRAKAGVTGLAYDGQLFYATASNPCPSTSYEVTDGAWWRDTTRWPTYKPFVDPVPEDCGADAICGDNDVVRAIDRLHADLLVLRDRASVAETARADANASLMQLRERAATAEPVRASISSALRSTDGATAAQLLRSIRDQEPEPMELAAATVSELSSPTVDSGARLNSSVWFVAGLVLVGAIVAPLMRRVFLP